MQTVAGPATGATVEPGLKIETAIGRADDPTARDVQPSPFAVKRTVTTDTQQRSDALRDGCTPSASGVSGLSSQGANPKKPKGRSGPKSKCSPYIGVSQYKRTGRWEAHIWDSNSSTKGTPVSSSKSGKGKQLHLGSFPTAVHAARAYDRAALLLRGPTAALNFPVEEYHGDPLLEELGNMTRPQMILALRKSADVEAEAAAMEAAALEFSTKVPELLQSMTAAAAAARETTSTTGAPAASSDGGHPSGSLTHTMPSTPALTWEGHTASAGGDSSGVDWLQIYEQQVLLQQQQQQQQQQLLLQGEQQLLQGEQQLPGFDSSQYQQQLQALMPPPPTNLYHQHHQQQQQQHPESAGPPGRDGLMGHSAPFQGLQPASASAAAAAATAPPTAVLPPGFSTAVEGFEAYQHGVYQLHHPEPWSGPVPTYNYLASPYPLQQQQHAHPPMDTLRPSGHSYGSMAAHLPHTHLTTSSSYHSLHFEGPHTQHWQHHWPAHHTAAPPPPPSAAAAAREAPTPWLNNMATAHVYQPPLPQQQQLMAGNATSRPSGRPSSPGSSHTQMPHAFNPTGPAGGMSTPPSALAARHLESNAGGHQQTPHAQQQQQQQQQQHSLQLADSGSWQEYQLWRQQQHQQQQHLAYTLQADSMTAGPWAVTAAQQHHTPHAAPVAAAVRGRLPATHGVVVTSSSTPQAHHRVPTRSSSTADGAAHWAQHAQAQASGNIPEAAMHHLAHPSTTAAAGAAGAAAAMQLQESAYAWPTGAAAARGVAGGGGGTMAVLRAASGGSNATATGATQQQLQQLGNQGSQNPAEQQHTPTQAVLTVPAAAAPTTVVTSDGHGFHQQQWPPGAVQPLNTQHTSTAQNHTAQQQQQQQQPVDTAGAVLSAAAAAPAAGAASHPVRQLSLGAQATLMAAYQAGQSTAAVPTLPPTRPTATTAAAAVTAAAAAHPAGPQASAAGTSAAAAAAAAVAAALAGDGTGTAGQRAKRTSSGLSAELARALSGVRPGQALQRRSSSISAELASDLLLECEAVLFTQHSLPGLDQLDALLAGANVSPTLSSFALSSEGGPAPLAAADAATAAAAAAAASTATATPGPLVPGVSGAGSGSAVIAAPPAAAVPEAAAAQQGVQGGASTEVAAAITAEGAAALLQPAAAKRASAVLEGRQGDPKRLKPHAQAAAAAAAQTHSRAAVGAAQGVAAAGYEGLQQPGGAAAVDPAAGSRVNPSVGQGVVPAAMAMQGGVLTDEALAWLELMQD